MTNSILICDDSSFARKQIARVLPASLQNQVSFAANGKEAVDLIKQGKGDLLILDLNMPVMDGYEVLQAIRDQSLNSIVVVVSGDVQPDAYKRVMSLGAMEFIRKPVNPDELRKTLSNFGVSLEDSEKNIEITTEIWDCFKEIANVAMGQAADLLARRLNAFIQMPIPKVKLIKSHDLNNTFIALDKADQVSVVCQGFLGTGVSGEALLIFQHSSYADMAKLLKYDTKLDDCSRGEVLMDIGSIISGAFIRSIAKQLDLHLSFSTPSVWLNIDSKQLKQRPRQEQRVLAIEMRCAVEGYNIKAHLLLLFSESSLEQLEKIAELIAA